MSLIKCDECGKEVSSKAKACPNCGNPIGEGNTNLPVIKVIIKSKITLMLRTSVSIDNLSVGELGSDSKKEIELELPVGIHYIGLETIVKHGSNYQLLVNGLPETAAVSSAKDGKQFTIDEKDGLIEIEILSKGSFSNSSGRCIVGEIKKYNQDEANKKKEEKQELIKKEEERQQQVKEKQAQMQNTIDNFIKKYGIPLVIGIVIIFLIIFLVNKNKSNQEIRSAAKGVYTGYISDRKMYVRAYIKDDGQIIISYSRTYDSLKAGQYEKTYDDIYYKTERSSLDYIIFTFLKTEYHCYLSDTDLYSETKKVLKCRTPYGGEDFELVENKY